MQAIPVFFTIDDRYAPFLAVALSSAIKNADPQKHYEAIILHQGVTEENQARIQVLATDNFVIRFLPMTAKMDAIKDCIGNRLRCDYFALSIYFRLFIPAMFPEYDKAVYIDSDVVVTGDLSTLFDTPLGDNYLAACREVSIADVKPLMDYTRDVVGMPTGTYFNSGVLVMNLKLLREKQLDRRFLELLDTWHFDCLAPDQDYLNAMCRGKILYLDQRWNAEPNENRKPLENPSLIHYNLFSKPWCYDGVQYEDIFWKYAKSSGYYGELLAHKENYTTEQKLSDTQCLQRMVERSFDIMKQEKTFRKLGEKGVRIRL